MQLEAKARPTGALGLLFMPQNPFGNRQAAHPLNLLRHAFPRPGLSREVNVWRFKNLPNVFRGLWRLYAALIVGAPTQYGALFLRKKNQFGIWTEFGLASLRLVTDSGVADITSRMAGTSAANIANFKFHGFGTGTTAEAATQTALVTELTTQYNPDSTRPTGSQASAGTVGSATYTTVATLSPDSGGTIAVTEHAPLSQAATGGGTMLDRSVFSAVNLVASADSLQATYVLTLTSGG